MDHSKVCLSFFPIYFVHIWYFFPFISYIFYFFPFISYILLFFPIYFVHIFIFSHFFRTYLVFFPIYFVHIFVFFHLFCFDVFCSLMKCFNYLNYSSIVHFIIFVVFFSINNSLITHSSFELISASVTAVEQLSGSNDGLDGLPGPSPSQLQGQYPSGPPQNSNFSARGGGGPPQFSGGPQEGPQQYGYPPQSYGGAPQSEMGGQPGVPAYWTGPGGASAPGIPFEGRGLQGELGDRGEDGMSQHRGPGQHGAARPPPMGQGYPGMERNEYAQSINQPKD